MSLRLQLSRIAPWTGLFVGAAAWFADQQIASDANVWDCKAAGGPFAVGVGLACIFLSVLGGVISWRATPHAEGQNLESRVFARFVGVAAAGIFTLAIAFGAWAGVLLPGCHR